MFFFMQLWLSGLKTLVLGKINICLYLHKLSSQGVDFFCIYVYLDHTYLRSKA